MTPADAPLAGPSTIFHKQMIAMRLQLSLVLSPLLVCIAVCAQAQADTLEALRLKMGVTLSEVGQRGYGLLGMRGVDWSVPRDSAAFASYTASLDQRRKLRATAERRCGAEALRVTFLGAPAEWQMSLSAAQLPAGADVAKAGSEISSGRKPEPAKVERMFVSLWVSDNVPENRVLCLGFIDDKLAFVSVLTELTPARDADALMASLRRQLGLGVNPLGLAAEERNWIDRDAGLFIEHRPVFGVLTWSDRTHRGALVKALAEAWGR